MVMRGAVIEKLFTSCSGWFEGCSSSSSWSSPTSPLDLKLVMSRVHNSSCDEAVSGQQEVVVKEVNDKVQNVVEEVVEVINTSKLIIDAAQVSAAGDIVSTASAATTNKGKGILIEPVKPIKKKDQIRIDEEAALKLQAEFDEKERLTREKAKKEQEANIALIETWDDIHAKIDVDHQLAERMQAQEQEELVGGRQKKRAGEELIQESTKKQKVEDDKETAELKQLMEIIPEEEEIAIDAIPLAIKPPKIVG
ncbi:hypothetical protein Tco_1335009 [Tanacetum coccineum]